MIVTPFTPDYPTAILGPAMATSPTGPRTGGLHLTDILRDMAETAGIGKGESGFSEESLDWFACMGWLWERVFDMAHREAIADGDISHTGEFECDGITGTPDRIDWRVPKIIELKCRWKSVNSFENLERSYWIELMQVAAYCWMTGIYEADLIIFFVAGNWRPPVPQVKGAHLEFTELELAEKWRSIVAHAKHRGWL
jgi:hypothetical protein